MALAYVEPGLYVQQTKMLSVIVTAADSAAAEQAVAHVGGQVSSELWLIDAVAATVPVDQLETLAATPGLASVVANKGLEAAQDPALTDWDGWVTDHRFSIPWDGSPDMQPASSWNVYKAVYPLPIDLGTDTLYGLSGVEIGVAVVDSGVYFDDQVKSELGQNVRKLFRGQADFVDAACGSYVARNNKVKPAGTQQEDYCFTDAEQSRDPYGHGTHVAGIIWNQLSDLETGVRLGIAPEAKVLSVRVLGADGTGTYEDVIKGIQYVEPTEMNSTSGC